MKIPVTKPFFDEKEFEFLKDTLDSGWVAQGPQTMEFEKRVAKHEGHRYAIATSNCTTALYLALLVNGVGRGQDVLVPSFTFVATANSVMYTGAIPVFADIDLDTFNMSMDSVEEIISKDYMYAENRLVNKNSGNILTCIMPVHQFGLCANMPKINAIASKYGLTVVEDAACALGASMGGVHQGGFGNVSCVSFHPRKCITTGEGGMIFTDNEDQYIRLKELRSHGATVSEVTRDGNKRGYLLPEYSVLGFNYRLSDIQSAVGLAQVEKLDNILARRRYLAKRYDQLLQEFDWLVLPTEPENYWHTYQSYVCRMRHEYKQNQIEELNILRNKIMEDLEGEEIQTRQGTHAIHMLRLYQEKFGYSSYSYPNSLIADRLSFTLPLYASQTEDEQDFVVEQLAKAYKKESK